MSNNIIFFDLDGTIIDSAPEIISSLECAFDFFNIEPNKNLTSNLIGPPIDFLIKDLLSAAHISKTNDILQKFKYFYDSKFCYESDCFEDIYETLEYLCNKNSLILVTNKRLLPTKKILVNNNLLKFFDEYHSVDLKSKTIFDKKNLLNKIIEDKNLIKKNCYYIGDTVSDFIASDSNNINFIYANWGYGETKTKKDFFVAQKPSELKNLF